MNVKTLPRFEVKDADKGAVECVFAEFGTKDSDGDVTVKGAFTEGAPLVVSAYGHTSHTKYGGNLPVGKGEIRTTESEAIGELKFFLDTAAGHDSFLVVKQLGELQEWSYGYEVKDFAWGQLNGEKVRLLKSVDVIEVSPVLRGAGTNTRTLSAKALKQMDSDLHRALRTAGTDRFGGVSKYVYVEDFDLDDLWVIYWIESNTSEYSLVRVAFTRAEDGSIELAQETEEVERVTRFAPKGAKFFEHVTAVLADVGGLIDRASEIKALRAEKGKALSGVSTDLLGSLGTQMKRLEELLTDTDAPPTDEHRDAVLRELMKFQRSVARTQGVAV